MVAASRAGQYSATATVEVEIAVELMPKSVSSARIIKHTVLKLLISHCVFSGFMNFYHHGTIY
jgi:hypothetical protein